MKIYLWEKVSLKLTAMSAKRRAKQYQKIVQTTTESLVWNPDQESER